MSTGVRMPSTRNSPHVSNHPVVGKRRPVARTSRPEDRHAPGGEGEGRYAEVQVQVAGHRGQPVADAPSAGIRGGRCRLAADAGQLGAIGLEEVRIVDNHRDDDRGDRGE